MCFGSKPKIPEAPPPPSQVGANISGRRESRLRQIAQAESGRQSTILTSSRGVGNTSATKKTLLGQ